jgi:hypothetical protein
MPSASVIAPGATARPRELNNDHQNRPPILDHDLGDAAQMRPQVYFNPILEAIGTPAGSPPISRHQRLDISWKHEISQSRDSSGPGR